MLCYHKRNFFMAPSSLKVQPYKTLVCTKLEYAAAVLDPGLIYNMSSLEWVQNRSVRFILSDYDRTASVSSMKVTLSLPDLSLRRQIFWLCFSHQIYNTLFLKDRLLTRPFYISSRRGHAPNVGIPRSNSNAFFISFISKASVQWNHLESYIATLAHSFLFGTAIISLFSCEELWPGPMCFFFIYRHIAALFLTCFCMYRYFYYFTSTVPHSPSIMPLTLRV